MEWFSRLFRGFRAKPQPQRVAVTESRPIRTPAMERAGLLSKDDWIAERLAQAPVTQLLAVKGIQQSHVQALQNAGIRTLLQLQQCQKSPLMGATNDWVSEWFDGYIADLALEYTQLRRAGLTIV